MKIIGVTGNIGSGKSMVDGYMNQQYGIPLIDVDLAAKAVLEKNKLGLMDFGNNFVQNGKINYDAIFQDIFYDEEKIREYNNWIHPLVSKEVEGQLQVLQEGGATSAIISAALIFEARIKTDTLILVSCPEEKRAERLLRRSIKAYQKAKRLGELQFPSEIMQLYCNYIIDNGKDFESSTVPQIEKIMTEILKE